MDTFIPVGNFFNKSPKELLFALGFSIVWSSLVTLGFYLFGAFNCKTCDKENNEVSTQICESCGMAALRDKEDMIEDLNACKMPFCKDSHLSHDFIHDIKVDYEDEELTHIIFLREMTSTSTVLCKLKAFLSDPEYEHYDSLTMIIDTTDISLLVVKQIIEMFNHVQSRGYKIIVYVPYKALGYGTLICLMANEVYVENETVFGTVNPTINLSSFPNEEITCQAVACYTGPDLNGWIAASLAKSKLLDVENILNMSRHSSPELKSLLLYGITEKYKQNSIVDWRSLNQSATAGFIVRLDGRHKLRYIAFAEI